MITLRIKPTRELFFNEDDLYGIYGAEVHPEDVTNEVVLNRYGNISFKGSMPQLKLKEEYHVTLTVDSGSSYAGSYNLHSIKQEKPVTPDEQRVYLSEILTETQVKEIYKVYSESDNIIQLIEDNKFEYNKVKGLGEKTFHKLREKVLSNLDLSEILAFCSKYGIKYSMLAPLVKKYGNPQLIIQKIEKNPYVLTEYKGIGFTKADEIAKAIGYDMLSPVRIVSAIGYIISEENRSGHSWISRKPLFSRAIDLLNIDKSHIAKILDSEEKNKHFEKLSDERFTTPSVLDNESYLAHELVRLSKGSRKLFESEFIDNFLNEYCAENNVELEENQRQFFHDWNENNVVLLVGGGGMGKL